MFERRSGWFALASFTVASLLLATLAVVGTSAADPKSTPLRGRMLDISNVPCSSATGVCSSFTAIGTINGSGLLFVDTFPSAGGVSTHHTVIQTSKGELQCHGTMVFDLSGPDHAFVELCLITGGTGIYQNATGYIQGIGTFDFAANLGQEEYSGLLVRPAN